MRNFLPDAPHLPALDADRVVLRWLVPEDVPALFTIFGDPAVTRYWSSPAMADESVAATLLANIHDHFAARSLFQ